MFSRIADALRGSPWRTRGGVIVGAPLARGLGLPVRLILWALLGIGLFFGMKQVIAWMTPAAADRNAEPPTPWAVLYVACTNPDCHASKTTRQPPDFRGWPLTCGRCGQASVRRATLCPRCGTWVAPEGAACWRCAALQSATQPRPRVRSANPDDDEDGWE
jgi:hypothetical protein